MIYFPFIALFFSLVALIIGVVVFTQNPREFINRTFLLLAIASAYWTFTEFGLQLAETFERAYFWHRLGAFWPLSAAALALFFLAVTNQEGQSKTRLGYLIFLPSILFSILSGTMDLLTGVPIRTSWGWNENPPVNPLIFYLSVTWAYILAIISIVLCIRYYKRLTDNNKKHQLKLVVLGLVPPMATGISTEVILPLFGIQFPELTAHAFALSSIIIGHAILRSNLFIITPAVAAENILSTMSDFLFITNLDGAIQRVNQTTLNILGYNEHELIDQPVSKLFTENNIESTLLKKQSRTMQNAYTILHDVEMTLQTNDNESIPISLTSSAIRDSNGNPRGILYIARDITQRKETEIKLQNAKLELEQRVKERTFDLSTVNEQLRQEITERERIEAALRESEAKYSVLVEQAQDTVVIVQDGVFQFVNYAGAKLTGYSLNELIGMSFLDIAARESRELVRTRFQARMAGNPVPPVYEMKIQCKNGEIKTVELAAGVIQYQGNPANMGIIRDITTRRDLEEKRADFISMTSHELRTPLTAIRGFIEIIEQQEDNLNKQIKIKCYEILNRNVKRLERLIAGVSTLGQLERGVFHLNMDSINFYDILIEALQPYQTFLESQLEVQGGVNNESVLIEGDSDRLIQVLDNILDNAIKNTPPNTRKILISTQYDTKMLKVIITDNGAGITSDDLGIIFEPFTAISTAYSAGGSGIGLYVSRMIIEAHKGTLVAESTGKGLGASFIITLPRIVNISKDPI